MRELKQQRTKGGAVAGSASATVVGGRGVVVATLRLPRSKCNTSALCARKRGGMESRMKSSSCLVTRHFWWSVVELEVMPTKLQESPTLSASVASTAERTGVLPSSLGSYCTTATLCTSCRYTMRPGISTEAATVTMTSPKLMGVVLRSTTTRPRFASTTTPVQRTRMGAAGSGACKRAGKQTGSTWDENPYQCQRRRSGVRHRP